MLDSLVIKDGKLQRANSAGISPLAESFAYGFGVFTTIKCLNTRLCHFDSHYERLAKSADAIDMFLNRSRDELLEDARSLIAVEGVINGIIKISILREQGGSHCCLYMRSKEFPEPILEPQRICLSEISRYSRSPQSLYKTHNYMENILALQQARALGMDEAVLTNERGEITESCMSNIFILQGDKLTTPRSSCGLQSGVARSRILELAAVAGLRVMEGTYFANDLLRASEVFLTNSVRGVIPVGQFRTTRDKVEYPSKITEHLRALYHEDEARHMV